MPLADVAFYLNAYPLDLARAQTFWCVRLAPGNSSRAEIRRRLGVPVWLADGSAWAVSEPAGESERRQVDLHEQPDLHAFAVRESLVARARSLRWDSWFVMHEFNATPPDAGKQAGPVIVEDVLKVRITHEGVHEPTLLAVMSASTRWRMDGTLADARYAPFASGETAVRLSGSGPRRARIERVHGGELLLAATRHQAEVHVQASDYGLVARPALVNRFLTATRPNEARDIYKSVLVASGTLMSNRETFNRYAVKERYRRTEGLIEQFGRELTLPNNSKARIDTTPLEIRVRETA